MDGLQPPFNWASTKKFMKKIIFFISLNIFCNVAIAQEETSYICDSKIPKLKLNHAIQLIMKHTEKSNNADKKILIDGAKLMCQDNNLNWLIRYRPNANASGHKYLIVWMNKAIENYNPTTID